MSPFSLVAACGAGLLVAGWLCVSFMRPGPRRAAIEWIATTALYLTLGSWFIGLSLDARAEGRTWLLVPFGFLAFLFSAGFCVSTWRTLAQLAGAREKGTSATN